MGPVSGIQRETEVDRGEQDPAEAWSRDRNAALSAALVPGLVFGLLYGLVNGLAGGLLLGLLAWTALSAVSASGYATYACIRLAIQHRTPPRMIAFLEDARARNLLRTVGPLYQFRHAELQDRLASAPTEQPAREAGVPD